MNKAIALAVVFLMVSPAAADEQDQVKEDLKVKLDSSVSLEFKEKPMEEVLDHIRRMKGINIAVDPTAREKLAELGENVSIKLDDVKTRTALKFILGQKDLSAVYRSGALVVLPKDQVKKSVHVKIYYIHDLLMSIQDFNPPKITPMSSMSGGGGTFGEVGGGGPVFGLTLTIEDDPRESKLEDDFVLNMIRNNTGGDSWTENENTNMTISNGMLVITQTKKVHEEIQKVLGAMRLLR
ncbi:MAG: hypothetical protein A2Z34_01070 [Planctomycetes bacterium RBG_16_59_8]|nr:MAG: hypothetical protein A2Z34_01070 [Planctomycetes bacterium RBG_16_59_8]